MPTAKTANPWTWMQPHDAARMGEVILDPAEQKRWSSALMLGGLPYMWCVKAKHLREMMFARMGMKPGDRVLMFGESLESCRFADDIREAIGPEGEIVEIDITEEARSNYFAGQRGRDGQLATWSYRKYVEQFPDNHFDAVGVLQGVQHSDDWAETAGDFTRITKPGGPVLLAEITFSPAMVMKAESDLHLGYWLEKMSAAVGWTMDAFPYHSPASLIAAFEGKGSLDLEIEWKGLEIEMFRAL